MMQHSTGEVKVKGEEINPSLSFVIFFERKCWGCSGFLAALIPINLFILSPLLPNSNTLHAHTQAA